MKTWEIKSNDGTEYKQNDDYITINEELFTLPKRMTIQIEEENAKLRDRRDVQLSDQGKKKKERKRRQIKIQTKDNLRR